MEHEIYITFNEYIQKRLQNTKRDFLNELNYLKSDSILIREINDRLNIEKDFLLFTELILTNCNTFEKIPVQNILVYIIVDCDSFIRSYSDKLSHKSNDTYMNVIPVKCTIALIKKVYDFFRWYNTTLIDLLYICNDGLFMDYYNKLRVYPFILHRLYNNWKEYLSQGRISPLSDTSSLTPTNSPLSNRVILTPIINHTIENDDIHINIESTPRIKRTSSEPRIPGLKLNKVIKTPVSDNNRECSNKKRKKKLFKFSSFSPRNLFK